MSRLVFLSVLCFLTFFNVCKALNNLVELSPIVDSVNVMNETLFESPNGDLYHKLILELRGSNFYSGMKVRVTTNSVENGCPESKHSGSDDNLCEFWSNSTFSVMSVQLKSEPGLSEKNFYICVKLVHRTSPDKGFLISTLSSDVVKWIHQGKNVAFHTKNVESMDESKSVAKSSFLRHRREDWTKTDVAFGGTNSSPPAVASPVHLYGFRLESSEAASEMESDGVPQIKVGSSGLLRLFGYGWTENSRFALTTMNVTRGTHCEYLAREEPLKLESDPDKNTALLNVKVPSIGITGATYYLCSKEEATSGNTSGIVRNWFHLGNEQFLQIRSYEDFLPVWLSITIIVTCLSFSSLFSGLNLGLMSLNQTDLKIICNTGTEAERRYARVILPVRSHGNYLLCSILLGNVMVNSILTVLIESLTSGLVSVIASTLAIVIFGEISPQAICSRHGLAIGAKTIYITKVVMFITFPLSYPISRALDFLLGEEIGAVYTRERLKELVKLTTEFNDLENDEVNIISGALELRKKTAGDVMTKLENVFMLPADAILDFETVSHIMKQGFSRIPVYETYKSNIISMLFIKDLALVDPDDCTPLRTHCQFYQNPCYFIFEDTTLDVLFKQFKSGIQGHMAFVHRVNNEGDGDPFYETIGLITLEDVIEELIQAEINDETDVWTDNNFKKRRSERNVKPDFLSFAERNEKHRTHISAQLTLATFQFLSTSVDSFKPEHISETILRRLLKHDIFFHIKIKKDGNYLTDPNTVIYQQGKAADYFVLILEGRVQVTVGKENLVFESGPFTHFGHQAITQNIGVVESPSTPASQQLGSLQSVNLDSLMRVSFIPDYSVRAITEVFYLRINRTFYMAAKRATLMEKSKKEESVLGDNFDAEVDKLLHSSFTVDERRRSHGSPDITRTQSQHGSPGHTSPNTILNNGSLYASSEPVLVSPSRTPKSADINPGEERSKLLKPTDS